MAEIPMFSGFPSAYTAILSLVPGKRIFCRARDRYLGARRQDRFDLSHDALHLRWPPGREPRSQVHAGSFEQVAGEVRAGPRQHAEIAVAGRGARGTISEDALSAVRR